MGLGIPIIDAIINLGGTVADKIWMDKGEKEKLEFSKEQFVEQIKLAVKQLDQAGELAEMEMVFKESQAQRDYVQDQFGTAEQMKSFFIGRVILLGRASIRWIITGFAMWQTYQIMNIVLTPQVITALSTGVLSAGAVWLVSLLVSAVVGIPLFYVSGISIEKLLKVRGII
jgi:hypothetical protein